MRFLQPQLLLWSALAAVAVGLYLFRRRPRTVRVSTLPFFKSLAREHQESAWLRRLKHLLSLLLSVLVIAAGTAALARLVVAPPAEAMSSVLVLVDRSASMAAVDAGGQSRLKAALGKARERLAGLPGGIGVTVMAYDRRPQIVLPRSYDRREVERALASIEVRPIAGEPVAALRLARRLAALELPAAIWHLTDTPEAPRKPVAAAAADMRKAESSKANANTPLAERADYLGVKVETMALPLPAAVNAGLTAFALRRQPLSHHLYEAFVQVHCSASQPLEADLEVRFDGTLTEIRKLALTPGGRQRLLIPVDSRRWRTIGLAVKARGDAMPLDDRLEARIPAFKPLEVQWISRTPDPFTQLALTSLGDESGFVVSHGAPATWPPKSPGDVVIFDGWLPKKWPAKGGVIVIDPPGSLGPLQAVRLDGVSENGASEGGAGDSSGGLPVDAVRNAQPGHPVLYGVATQRLSPLQTAVLVTSGPLQPLLVGPSGPVLSAGERRGQRIVVLAFAPGRSERLPLMASYPLLLGNALLWCAQPPSESQGGNNRRTGDFVALPGNTLTWQIPRTGSTREFEQPLTATLTELDRIGLWQTDRGKKGSAALLSPAETLLPHAVQPAVAQQATSLGGWSPFHGDLSMPLIWLALAVLVIESLLFHRYAIY